MEDKEKIETCSCGCECEECIVMKIANVDAIAKNANATNAAIAKNAVVKTVNAS